MKSVQHRPVEARAMPCFSSGHFKVFFKQNAAVRKVNGLGVTASLHRLLFHRLREILSLLKKLHFFFPLDACDTADILKDIARADIPLSIQ
jgi:hypothetical protein